MTLSAVPHEGQTKEGNKTSTHIRSPRALQNYEALLQKIGVETNFIFGEALHLFENREYLSDAMIIILTLTLKLALIHHASSSSLT